MKLSEVLRKVADHEEPGCAWDWKTGLCNGIYRNFGHAVELRARDLMDKHPDHSGNRLYPIPADPDHMHGVYDGQGTWPSPPKAFVAYHAHLDPDMYTGTYGKKRREMALYLSILFAAEGM